MKHMTAPGSDVRGNVLPSGLRRDPAPSPGCYRVELRDSRGRTRRPIVVADNREHAIDKALVLFPRSSPGRQGPVFIHERRPHSSSERFVAGWSYVDRRRRVA